MTHKPTLVVLAAGMGSRFGGNKQTEGMGPSGETIMDYSIYDAIQAGFGKVVFIVRKHMKELMEERFLRKLDGLIETELVYQELEYLPEGYSVPEGRVKPWGTGHALLMAKNAVKGNFVVINADDFYASTSFKIIAEYLNNTDENLKEHCLVGYELRQTLSENGGVSRGICSADSARFLTTVEEHHKIQRSEDGLIKGFDENDLQKVFNEDTEVSMNFWGFTKQYFNDLESGLIDFLQEKGHEMKSEYLIPSSVNDCMKRGDTKVKMLHSSDRWYGVTYKEDQPVVEQYLKELVQSGSYPSPLFSKY
jgi:choline kinase